MAYDLTLWRLFRTVKPPEEAAVQQGETKSA
jgi:hypothetical protein